MQLIFPYIYQLDENATNLIIKETLLNDKHFRNFVNTSDDILLDKIKSYITYGVEMYRLRKSDPASNLIYYLLGTFDMKTPDIDQITNNVYYMCRLAKDTLNQPGDPVYKLRINTNSNEDPITDRDLDLL